MRLPLETNPFNAMLKARGYTGRFRNTPSEHLRKKTCWLRLKAALFFLQREKKLSYRTFVALYFLVLGHHLCQPASQTVVKTHA